MQNFMAWSYAFPLHIAKCTGWAILLLFTKSKFVYNKLNMPNLVHLWNATFIQNFMAWSYFINFHIHVHIITSTYKIQWLMAIDWGYLLWFTRMQFCFWLFTCVLSFIVLNATMTQLQACMCPHYNVLAEAVYLSLLVVYTCVSL